MIKCPKYIKPPKFIFKEKSISILYGLLHNDKKLTDYECQFNTEDYRWLVSAFHFLRTHKCFYQSDIKRRYIQPLLSEIKALYKINISYSPEDICKIIYNLEQVDNLPETLIYPIFKDNLHRQYKIALMYHLADMPGYILITKLNEEIRDSV